MASIATLDLTRNEYDLLMRNGFISISRDHPITTSVERVRVIVFDENTDRSGSVTFPVR